MSVASALIFSDSPQCVVVGFNSVDPQCFASLSPWPSNAVRHYCT